MLRSAATLCLWFFFFFFFFASLSLTARSPGAGAADDVMRESSGDALSDLANAKAILEIHPMDVWAQTLPTKGTTLVVTRPEPASRSSRRRRPFRSR